ncbi:MAB_1171c family putative transporter [Streptomyces sp. NPDC097941]|uniref:MAB_1171c family putative transporter n=1 Tax=Streptomyces sp. NPDC097941 TaxID=3155685 RepID=UPI003316D69D
MGTEVASFGNALATPAVICLWVAILARIPSGARSREQRGLWLAVISAAAAMTLNLPSVVNFLAQDVASGHKVSLARNCIGVVSAGAVLYFVASVTQRHRLRILALASIVLYPGILLVLDGITPPHGSHSFLVDRQAIPSTLYWLALIASHLLADSACSAVCWSYGRRAANRSLSVSLLVFGGGTLFAGLYWVVLLSEIVTSSNQGMAVAPLLMSLHGFLRAAALLVPPVTSFLASTQDGIVAWRLWPLWKDLVTVVPNVVLSPPQGRLEELVRPAVPRGLLVYRKVIEIRDAILVLEGHAGYSDVPRIQAGHSESHNSLSAAQQVVVLAHAIKEARQAKMDKKPEMRTSLSFGALGSCDLDEEKRFLLDVTRVYLNTSVHAHVERGGRKSDI